MSKASVMVLGGGTWQVPLIKRIKELGYEVVCSNLYADSVGFQYADFGEVSDVKDLEKNLSFAKKHKVDAVLTDQSDIAVPTVAYVATQLGLPNIGEDMAKLFTNKYLMREFCRSHKFPFPEYALCQSSDEVARFLKKTGRKIIIKPLDSQSSRGVYEIEQESEISALFEDTKSYSKDGKSVIAERFISGTEFTIDGVMTPRGHVSLCISQKAHFSYNESIASELFFSNVNPDYDYDQLRRTNNAIVNASGLPFGLTHAEYKFENGEYYLIEIAARGGGTKIASDIVPLMSGVDNYAYLISCALGCPDTAPMEPDASLIDRCAVLKFLDINSNGKTVTGIHGVDKIKNNEHVLDFCLEFSVGDQVGAAKDDRSRVGYYIAYEENRDKLRNLMAWIEDTLKVDFS